MSEQEQYGHIPDGFFLSEKEIEDLRNTKKELTTYGREKLKELIENRKQKMTEPIKVKVSDEDFQKVLNLMGNQEPYPDKFFAAAEKAHRREKLNAGFKQDENGNWYRPELKDLTRNERIDLAEKEIAYLVMGGQDVREYANSIALIMDVLDSLREKD